jgi:hypothetical protein
MGTGLGQSLNVRETAKRLRGIQFKGLNLSRESTGEGQRRLPDSRRAMEKENCGIGWSPKIGEDALLDIHMADDSLQPVWAASFAPHASVSSSSRK